MDKDNATLEFSSNLQHEGMLDMSKYSTVSHNTNEPLVNDQSSQVNKTEEMYKDIVDRVNRSREYLESMQRSSTLNENNSDQRIKVEPDISSKPSAPTFRPEEKKKILSPVGNTKTPKHSSSTSDKVSAVSNQKQLYKGNVVGKSQSNKSGETFKSSKQLKSNTSKDKKHILISSDSDGADDGKDDVKALGSSGKKAGTRLTAKTVSKKSEAEILAKSRSPTKPETPKTKTVLKSANLNTSKNLKPDSIKNMSHSQSIVAERENLLQEQYVKLKLKSKEMKNTLQEYVDKCVGLEDLLKEKDQQLHEFQAQLRDSQNERIQNLDTMREFAKKEEQWLRTERELRSNNAAKDEAEFQQRRRLEELDSLARRNEQRYQSQPQYIQPDSKEGRHEVIVEQNRVLEALRFELESVRKESRLKDSRILELESANNHRNQEMNRLKEQLETFERQSRGNESKVDELKESKVHLEEKIIKLKKKLEDERNRFQLEKKAEADEKKEKIKKLKSELKQAEGLVQKLSEDKKILEFEVEKQANVNAALERTLERSKDELIDLQQQQYKLRF